MAAQLTRNQPPMIASDLKYCPYYCEENVWQMCTAADTDKDPWLALIISNPARRVALWQQRASDDIQLPVLWDYHVIAAQQQSQSWQIWDLDSRCGLPVAALDYLQQTFRRAPATLEPIFRVMNCADYRASLTSNRHHMRDAAGEFLRPPPDWPAIGNGHNLSQLIDMQWHGAGEILGLAALTRRLSRSAA
jgi:hypothetical protein